MSTGMFVKLLTDAMRRVFGITVPAAAGSLLKSTGGAPPYAWSELSPGGNGQFAGLALDTAPGGTTAFVNPITTFNQTDEPTVDQIPAGYMAIWTDTDDGKCRLAYNHGGTVKTVELT